MKIEEIMVESWESFDSSVDEKLDNIVVKYFELLKSKPKNGLDLMYKCIYEFNQLVDSEIGIEAGLGDSEPQNHMRTVVELLFKDYFTDNKEVYDAFEDSHSKRLFNLKRSAHLLIKQTEKAKSYDKSSIKNLFNHSLLLLDEKYPDFLNSVYDLVMVDDFSKLKSDMLSIQKMFSFKRDSFSNEQRKIIEDKLKESVGNSYIFWCLINGSVDWRELSRKNESLINLISKDEDKLNLELLSNLNKNMKRSEQYAKRFRRICKYLDREISRQESLKKNNNLIAY